MLKNDLLFPVRQKRTDLLTQLAVSVQGYLALDLIKRNNVELVKGVDRATTTTVSALRTAVIVAQALANQKLVLDQITALNETTGSLIESTSEMLKEQTGQVSQQAYEATVGIDKLEKAFANVYATMDEIDEFKIRSLDTMSRTISALESQVQRSRSYIDRARAEEARSHRSRPTRADRPGAAAAGKLMQMRRKWQPTPVKVARAASGRRPAAGASGASSARPGTWSACSSRSSRS